MIYSNAALKRSTTDDHRTPGCHLVREHLIKHLYIELEDFDRIPILAREDGWGLAIRAFDGSLRDLLNQRNEAIAV